MMRFQLKFRVWHIPQVPGVPFTVEVPTWPEALRLQNVLAGYDIFQLNNKIKPDFCNASGIQFYDHTIEDEELAEMELEDRWLDLFDFDDLQSRIDEFKERGIEVYHSLNGDVLDAGADIILNTPGDEIGDERNAVQLAQRIYDAINFAISEEE